jgi:hypothetical protein
MYFLTLPPEVPYQGDDLYAAAGLTPTEAALMPRYLAGIDDFYDTPAFNKLYEYFMDTQEMPYDVAKARTECPDEWILDRLAP